MDVSRVEDGQRIRPVLTERFTATWSASYAIRTLHLSFDYTGNVYSPMRLPLAGPLDPRSAYSPWWSIQNIQATYAPGRRNIEFYGGVKNLLNWTPAQGLPFLIARSSDPFDRQVEKNAQGQVMATPGNPYALTFDPSYVYAPNQSRHFFGGLRWTLK
jgi:outer membrane receptor for ferrienterochelin and colicins